MATPSLNPMPQGGPPNGGPPAPPTPPGGGLQPPPGPAAGGGNPAQKLAKLSMDAQSIAQEIPEAAPMMRAVQDQVRQATMKLIQQRTATQQQTPQI